MFRSCKSSVPTRSSFDKFKARPGPKCWYPSPLEAQKVQKMEGSSPPEAQKTEARHITIENQFFFVKWELFSCEFWMVWPLFYHFVVKNFERSGPYLLPFCCGEFLNVQPLFTIFDEYVCPLIHKTSDWKWSWISDHNHKKCEPRSLTIMIAKGPFQMSHNHSHSWFDWQWLPITFTHRYLWA